MTGDISPEQLCGDINNNVLVSADWYTPVPVCMTASSLILQYHITTNTRDQLVRLRTALLDAIPVVNRRAATVESIRTCIYPRCQHGDLSYGSTLESVPRTNPARTRQATEQPKHVWSITRTPRLDAISRSWNPVLNCGWPTNTVDFDLPTNHSIPDI